MGIGLKATEIARAFEVEALRQQYPPIQSPEQVGNMLGYARATIYDWLANGRFDGAYRKRGKHVRLWRDRVLDLFFNGPEWTRNEKHQQQ